MEVDARLIRSFIMLFTLIGLVAPAWAHPEPVSGRPTWLNASPWPDRIIVSPGRDPLTSLTLTWRTDATVSSSIAEIVEATGDSRFDLGAEAKGARYERVDLDRITTAHSRIGTPNHGLGPVHYHSVAFNDLKPNTTYAYRVRGARGYWSEWFQVRTAPQDGPVSFLYYGDAQYGILSHASRVFRQGLLSAPGADFVIHAGDLVNKGDRDMEWGEWFEASGFIHAMVPVLPVAGNHEYLETVEGGSKDGLAVLTDLWRPQFTLPIVDELPEALHETVYDLRYGDDLHVFILDSSSPHWEEQLDWLVASAAASTSTWKVVSMHHSPFRPGIQGYRNNIERGNYHRDRQDLFIAAAKRAGINLVLAGHNHSYTRASFGDNVGPGLPSQTARETLGTPRDVEIVVVVSISGAMSGTMTSERFSQNETKFANDIALERWANNTPTYQIITVDEDALTYRSHLATSAVYDSFSLTKLENGTVQMINGAAVFGATRRFETTGPYEGKEDLR